MIRALAVSLCVAALAASARADSYLVF